MPAHTLVVDIAPELPIVGGVGDLDLLPGRLRGMRDQFEFTGVYLEKLQVIEDSLSVEDNPAHPWGVTEAVLQGPNASAQI